MKHLFILFPITVFFYSCATTLGIEFREYATEYHWRIFDADNNTLHFTNEYKHEGDRLVFQNQDGATVDCLKCVAVENIHGDGWVSDRKK